MRIPEPFARAYADYRARWVAYRNRRIADPDFQKWTFSVPGLRWIAQRKAVRLFDHVAGFVYSQILSACMQVDLFGRLHAGPATLDRLARDCGLSDDAMARLLRAAASLDLAEQLPDGAWTLGELGAAMVGNPGAAAMVRHHGLLYDDLRDPLGLLRGAPASTRLREFWSYAGRDAVEGNQAADAYSELMAASQHLLAEDILDAYPFGQHRRMLDVGGGHGGFVAHAARRFPALALGLFDLPPVVEQARERLSRNGAAGAVAMIPGDFRRDSLPPGFDLVTLVRIVHDHNDDAALALFRAIHRMLPAHGVLLIAEPLAETPGARRIGDGYFGFYLLAMGQGRPRNLQEISGLLKAAGFRVVRRRRTRRPFLSSLIEVRP